MKNFNEEKNAMQYNILNEIVEFQRKIVLKNATELMTLDKNIYPISFIYVSAANRALSQLAAMATLLKDGNVLAVVTALRPHLDTMLRLFSMYIVQNPNEFAIYIIEGNKIDKYKDKNNVQLKDFHLVSKFQDFFKDDEKLKDNPKWVENVYKRTSGFIHLSTNHIETSTHNFKENGKFEFQITDKSNFNDDQFDEFIECLDRINYFINILLMGFNKNAP